MGFTIVPDEMHAQLIHVIAEDEWTWDGFLAMLRGLDEQIAIQGESDVIIDFTLSHYLPVGFSDNAQQISESFSPSIRTLTFVNVSSAQRVAIEMYDKLFPKEARRFHIVDTMEEAYHLLNLVPSR